MNEAQLLKSLKNKKIKEVYSNGDIIFIEFDDGLIVVFVATIHHAVQIAKVEDGEHRAWGFDRSMGIN